MGAASRPPARAALSRHRAHRPRETRGRADGRASLKSNSDDELVANAERHIADAHADLIGKPTRDDSLVSASMT
jgi:hypothetical protein